MKLSVALITLIANQAASVLATASPDAQAAERASLEAECGALGVMDWDLENLPAEVDRSKLRKCKEHPSGLNSPSKRSNDVFKRGNGCVKHPHKGECSKDGWCWKSCGFNNNKPPAKRINWCWLAWTDGRGDWIPCKSDADCQPDKIGRGDCAKGNCKECGCRCSG